MTEIEPISDDDHLAAICAALDGLPETSERPYRGMIARIRRDAAEIAALKARAMPAPRRYTAAEMESLPDGFYLAWLRRMKAWSVFVRVGGEWVWHGDEIVEPEADMARAWIAGPLSLPTPPEDPAHG